jgi:2-C-methyl-D-erythritol 4-phosphate cytidylyltransferase/2-C-methyl-D-erythritol 2,4-cyclodiphosphate synthase
LEIAAIVAAAGLGTRLGLGSKALVQLNGRTTLARAVELFLNLDEVTRIVVVGPPARLDIASAEVAALKPRKPVAVCAGGDSRQQSVRAGLLSLAGADYVLVHDAARPLASAALCRRVLAAAIQTGASPPRA